MHTKTTIMAIVLAAIMASIGVQVALVVALGAWLGLGTGIGLSAVVLIVYLVLVQPWHSRWGAADEEIRRTMPGDELIEGAASTTRAVSIRARPADIWPWLVQIGFGRAGWYSYDWIDNDGKPSADRIIPEFQDFKVGDQIVMIPGMGPEVRAMKPNEWLLSGDKEGGMWIPMSGKVTEETAFRVKAFEPNRWMLWEPWTWMLRPLDERTTRLIIRLRCTIDGPGPRF